MAVKLNMKISPSTGVVDLVCIIIILLASAGLSECSCPGGWKSWNGSCYHFHDITYTTSGMNWNDARKACQRYGGDLVIIQNNQEQQYLARIRTAAQRRQHYWIGVTDEAQEKQWKWIDGTSLSIDYWRRSHGEPNNQNGQEHCAEMHFDGLWNDNKCSREFAFICEKDENATIPTAITLPPLPSTTKNCKLTVIGTSYRGTTNTTISGLACQNWASQTPHKHEYNRPEDNPGENLINNYCRNPDLEPDGPWCYTTSRSKRWEYCDIPICDSGPISCEAGWTGFNNSCYRFVNERKTWFEGRKDCQDRGGDLVIINDLKEENFIANTAQKAGLAFWIGLTDKHTEGTFYWVDGTQLNASLAFWDSNEPSNAFGGEDCVELYSVYRLGKWNDNHCQTKRYYVCEKVDGKSQCPEDWVNYNDTCYQINSHPEQKTTWLQANAACQSFDGGQLVSIHNKETTITLYREMRKVFTMTGYYWIGLNDIKNENQFSWSDGTKYYYSNWGVDGDRKNKDGLDCVKSDLSTKAGSWSISNCSSSSELNYYICARKREYKRCHSPLGMENFGISDDQIRASSQKSYTTPPSSGRRNAVKAFGLDGAWCAATNDLNQWLNIDLGEYYKIVAIGLQGHPGTTSYVSSFYLTYSPDGKRWSVYGYHPPSQFKNLPGNSNSDRLLGAVADLSPNVKAKFIEIHPLSWSKAICMRVEVYGCPAVLDSETCGKGWINNTKLNTCYKFTMTKLPWPVARANCLMEDGDLLSLNTNEEYEFIRTKLNQYKGKIYSFWTGLNDRDYKRVFKWSDGSPVRSNTWYSGNPADRYYYRKNCVATRTYYLAFYDTLCSARLPYICKKTLKSNDPKDKFTGNWISTTDYYWPLDDVSNGELIGTKVGNIFGTFSSGTTDMKRQYLNFDGNTSHLTIPGFSQTCVSDPSLCTHGLTFSFLININSSIASGNFRVYIIDILGQKMPHDVGLNVFLENRMLGVYLRSLHHTWQSTVSPFFNNWIHFMFTWNGQFGLNIYINGVRKNTDGNGVKTGNGFKTDRFNNLHIGKSASANIFAKFKMMSLAIWQRYMSADEVKDIYLAELGRCKYGWLAYGQNCYQFNAASTSWTTAKVNCERQGGQLATIPTIMQNAFMSLKIGRYGLNTDVFIGLNARGTGSRRISFVRTNLRRTSLRRNNYFFGWVDGSPMTFSNWAPLSPSATWRRQDSVTLSASFNGRWKDIPYYYSRGSICQRKKDILPDSNRNGSSSFYRVIRQYSSVTVGCPLGTQLSFSFAEWGKLPTCNPISVLQRLRNLCSKNKYSCRLSASTSYFGDPCRGTRKELKLNYSCIAATDSEKAAGCDTLWSSMPASNVCYRLYHLKKTWADAREFCQQRGADLVSINSRMEEIYLTTLLIDSFELVSIWTGLNDLKLRGSYVWTDNSSVTYTNWYNHQPDDSSRRGSCVKTSLNRGYRDIMSWTDDNCRSLNSFICKKSTATFTTSTPVTTKVITKSCLPGWYRFGNDCYQFSTINATWLGARDACLLQKSYLASIHSMTENEAVFNFFLNTSLDSAWIGLHDKGLFRGQQWTDETPVNFVRWDYKQPDSNLGQQSCSVMANNGFWRDADCLVRRNYICKASIGMATVIPTTKRITMPVTPTPNAKFCPLGWLLSAATGNCYYFSNSTFTATWFMARTFCSDLGAQLTSIESQTEQDFLAPFLLTFRTREAWIGLSDLGTESGWEWVDQKPFSYYNWESTAPDDSHGMEDCVIMRRSGQWNDVYCGEKKAFICKRQNKTVPTARTVPPTAGPDKGFCENGWVHYRNKCYQFNVNEKLSWHGARNACRDQMTDGKRGDLVSIHASYENAFIFSQLQGMLSSLFIGLNDLQSERKFRWSDQSEVNYVNWYSRQPDNYWNREDCTEIWPYPMHKGRWNDVPCNGQQPYICQKDASATKPTGRPTPTGSSSCPDGYKVYAKNCYSFQKKKMTWDEARAFCKKENSRSELASLHSAYDAAYIFSQTAEFTYKVWIGLHRPANETKFRWSDNYPYDYTVWSSYPRGRYIHLRSCVYSEYSYYSNGLWRDSNCTVKLPFVCKINNAEKDIKPEHPGTCPKDWVKYGKYCYLIKNRYYGTRNWPMARQLCKDLGANLASIHSLEEQNFLYSRVSQGRKNVWIGLSDRRRENHMVWTDNTPNNFNNWDVKEPNDNRGIENCAEMILLSGKWNDASCSTYKGYICKMELGCNSEFGMKNASVIKDSQISASSVFSDFYAQNARLGKQGKPWCANELDTNQYLQVDLLVTSRVTRIAMKGYSSKYVLSYYLKYSDDGVQWKMYMLDGIPVILSGNSNSYSTNGVKLEPPVSARFIRINPLTWKNKICMSIELYGCGYFCNLPLGLESRTIKNEDITASSDIILKRAFDARLRNPRGQSWCAKYQNDAQWLQVKLSNKPVKITQVATQGTKDGDKEYFVKAYKIAYSDDARNWTVYKTYSGNIRIFSGNIYADTAVYHALTRPVTGKYIRFYPLSWKTNICMRVEVFGCSYECDKPLGIAIGKVPDRAMTASSSSENHAPSFARLNKGSFNIGSWCSFVADQRQYLQIDLGAETRLTGIATKGFEGDVSKYVTDYRVQFSFDAKFWISYEVQGVIQTFAGNSDGRTVKTNTFPIPLHARYIRINPRHWKQGICLRIELYGCFLAPVVYPTDAPLPKKQVITASIKFTEELYKEEYANKSSDEFNRMAHRIETAITKLYLEDFAFKDGFENIQVFELKPGSVVASFVIIFLTNDGNATWPLKKAVSRGKISDFVVDKSSLKLSNVNDKPEPRKSTVNNIVKREGLSTGGKIALVIIFLLAIASIIIIGLIYYFKRRGSGQFKHKKWNDSIGYESEIYSATGGTVHNLPTQD